MQLQSVVYIIIGISLVLIVALTLLALGLKKKFKSSKFFRNASSIHHLTRGTKKSPNTLRNPLMAQHQSNAVHTTILSDEQSAEKEFQSVLASTNLSAVPSAPAQHTVISHYYFDHTRQDRTGWPRRRNQKCTPILDKDRMLWDVVRRGRPDLLQEALRYVPSVTARTTYGFSILHVCAALCRKPQIAEILLNTAPQLVNDRTVYGTTPLMVAVEHSHLLVANLLISRGADINAQDSFGRTALMRGAAAGNSVTAGFLLSFQADVNIVDSDGHRAVDIALLSGNARVASDLQGSALAVVPGYISPKTQTTWQALMLLLSILMHFVDVLSDVLLVLALWEVRRLLAILSGIFVFLPSLLIALVPYQSLVERVLTLLQLRLVYEALLSMNQDRLTVRYGAVQMLHTVLENLPQMVIQGYLLSLSHGKKEDDDSDDGSVSSTTVVFALVTSLLSSAKKLQSMYLKRLDSEYRDKLNVGGVGVGQRSKGIMEDITLYFVVSMLFTILSLGLRLTAYVLVLVCWHPVACGLMLLWVLVSRLRIAALPLGSPHNRTHLEWTVVDLIAACMCDLPFSTNCDAFVMAATLSFLEMLGVFVGITLFWPQTCIALFCLLVVWWSLQLYMFVVIHGKHFSLPVKSGLWGDFVCFWRAAPMLRRLVMEVVDGLLLGMRFYGGLTCAYIGCSRVEGNSGARSSPPNGPSPASSGSSSADSSVSMFKLSRLLKREYYGLCLFVSLVFCLLSWLSSVFIGRCSSERSSPGHFFVDDDGQVECSGWYDDNFGAFGLKGAGYLFIVLYVVQIAEALTSPVAKHLRNVIFEEKYYESFLKARAEAPSITWHSEAYHMETRRVERRNADGSKSVHFQTVEVVTARASKNFVFDAWVDSSHNFPTDFTYAQFSSRSEHLFFDQYSIDNYKQEYDHFMRVNNTDAHQRKSTYFYVGNTTGPPIPQSLVYSSQLLFFVKYTYFLYATLLGCSFLYRWWITSLSSDVTVTVTKTMRKFPPGARPDHVLNYRY